MGNHKVQSSKFKVQSSKLKVQSFSKVFHQHIPYGDDVADASCQHEEVEHAVHVLPLVQRIEHGAGDVSDALGDNPYQGRRRHRLVQGLEGHQHAETHANETERLDVGVLLQVDETHDGSRDGTEPYEDEERPADR